MIIQTAPTGAPRLAILMQEHTALCQQFARAFGNGRFQSLAPLELMIYVISHHDAGWLDFDRDPAIDDKTGLPYNLVDTPPQHITVTSRRSPEFNQSHHPYCGLISSMHSWGLYNGRYGLSKLVLLDKIAAQDRPLADKMLNGELDRQKRLKAELEKDPQTSGWLDERKVFQNYKQLQFIDTLALYFNRIHPSERGEQISRMSRPARMKTPALPSVRLGQGSIRFRHFRLLQRTPSSGLQGAASCPVSATDRAVGRRL